MFCCSKFLNSDTYAVNVELLTYIELLGEQAWVVEEPQPWHRYASEPLVPNAAAAAGA